MTKITLNSDLVEMGIDEFADKAMPKKEDKKVKKKKKKKDK